MTLLSTCTLKYYNFTLQTIKNNPNFIALYEIQGVHRDAYKSKLKFKVEKIIRN